LILLWISISGFKSRLRNWPKKPKNDRTAVSRRFCGWRV
jgi:hypothetical protein